jgi:hypothetical protein
MRMATTVANVSNAGVSFQVTSAGFNAGFVQKK